MSDGLKPRRVEPLPGVRLPEPAGTMDESAWLGRRYVSARLTGPLRVLRVHNGENTHRWFSLDDQVCDTHEFVEEHALPVKKVGGQKVYFTHEAIFELLPASTINIGRCAPKFGHEGGGIQVEWVDGPAPVVVEERKLEVGTRSSDLGTQNGEQGKG